jgi:membrane-bound metal-dependent hydrolase YbcI (DUF457 family)
VDPLTHSLATLALQRSSVPKSSWRAILAILFAGLIPDIDSFSVSFGPANYLHWNRSVAHSITFVFLLTIVAFIFIQRFKQTPGQQSTRNFLWIAFPAAATLHIAMDLLQADAVTPLWPISAKRFSFDVFPTIDPWLLVILSAAILFPELIRLVGDEIGSRSKRPRGRTGAIAGLAFTILYFAMRALFHGNSVASLDARTVSGEVPHRVAAYPDSVSPFLWHSVVETESALHLSTLRSMGGEVSYASGITTLRKPEPSPVLTAAQNSPAAAEFLKFARFPKATVEQETAGYSVEITDLKDQAMQSKRAIFADVNIDANGKLISADLQWQSAARHF